MRRRRFFTGTLAAPSRRRISVTQTTSLARDHAWTAIKERRVTAASDTLPTQFQIVSHLGIFYNQFGIDHPLPQSVGESNFATVAGLS